MIAQRLCDALLSYDMYHILLEDSNCLAFVAESTSSLLVTEW